MKLNQKIRYAVGCLFELSNNPGTFIGAEALAHRQNIPAAYAHKVLQALARAGFVVSQKGLGYKLARPLSDISALEVIETLTVEVDANATQPDMGMRLEFQINKMLGQVKLGEVLCK